MTQLAKGRLWVALCSIAALSACEEGASLFGTTTTAPETTTTTTLVERDVEAPDVFQANENGLWDGRPSLGGVWVASTDATDPERVIIRNETNGKGHDLSPCLRGGPLRKPHTERIEASQRGGRLGG